jgi:long-subunit acyl-CoA synthetase (AMP-forming)
MADFAILAASAVTVPVYPTLLGWQIEYILNDAGTVAVVCSTKEQLDKVQEIRSHVPSAAHRSSSATARRRKECWCSATSSRTDAHSKR